MSRSKPVSRREFVQGLAAVMGGAAGSALLTPDALAQAATQPRFLIVVGASGGGSIVDGPLAVRASECATPDTLNTFDISKMPEDMREQYMAQMARFRAYMV